MATEYSSELRTDLHAAWMALHAIRTDLPFGALGHERWKKLHAAMGVINELKDENFAFLEQQIDALTQSLKENG